MAFHECGGHGPGDMPISLPKWVLEIGKDNQDIFFTDREGRRNTECLSWGVDKERVLKGRTGIEVLVINYLVHQSSSKFHNIKDLSEIIYYLQYRSINPFFIFHYYL